PPCASIVNWRDNLAVNGHRLNRSVVLGGGTVRPLSHVVNLAPWPTHTGLGHGGKVRRARAISEPAVADGVGVGVGATGAVGTAVAVTTAAVAVSTGVGDGVGEVPQPANNATPTIANFADGAFTKRLLETIGTGSSRSRPTI